MRFCFAFNTLEAQNKFQVLANCLSPAIWFPPTSDCWNCCCKGRRWLFSLPSLVASFLSSSFPLVWQPWILVTPLHLSSLRFCYPSFFGPLLLHLMRRPLHQSLPWAMSFTLLTSKATCLPAFPLKAYLGKALILSPTPESHLPISPCCSLAASELVQEKS